MLREQKLTQAQIGEQLGTPQHQISRYLKKYHDHGAIEHLGNNGRPLALSERAKSYVLKLILENPKMSLRKQAKKVEIELGEKVSHVTIKRFHNENGVHAYALKKKPLLTPRHIKLRWEISTLWLALTDSELKMIVFSDETKFNLRYSDGKVSVWRTKTSEVLSQHIEPTVKFGGCSVMVWACFSYGGVGKLVFVDETMDAPLYVTILASALSPSLEQMSLSDFIFQQDNDPKHTAKLTNTFFEQRNIKKLPWPPQSPDMNPIENLWNYIKVEVSKFQPKNINELKQRINIPSSLILKQRLNIPSAHTTFSYEKKRSLKYYFTV
jgi:hypothetical protein